MEEEKEAMGAASKEVSHQFKTLINSEEVENIKQLQHLIVREFSKLKFNSYFVSIWFVETCGDGTEEINSVSVKRLGRLQDSNAVLSHFNEYSERCFDDVSGDFSRNTRLLKSIKSDLDHIFMKLRSMKGKLLATYPDAFPDGSATTILDQRPDLESPL